MTGQRGSGEEPGRPARNSSRLRLPSFVNEADIGLGDALKRATRAVGVKPCGGCEKRAAALNRWITFTGRNRSHEN